VDDLGDALNSIRTMRSHLARSAEFRFYGPTAIGCTALLAAAASYLQAVLVAAPATHLLAYLTLWTITALLACSVIAADVVLCARSAHSRLADEMVREAAGQLLPAAAIGALLTAVIARYAPESAWMLPGLWQIVLALGVFSACRTLPAPMRLAGFWYAATGLACIAIAHGPHAFSPWAMALPFGIGEALAAVILYFARGSHEQDD
jgi:hypothetical protein